MNESLVNHVSHNIMSPPGYVTVPVTGTVPVTVTGTGRVMVTVTVTVTAVITAAGVRHSGVSAGADGDRSCHHHVQSPRPEFHDAECRIPDRQHDCPLCGCEPCRVVSPPQLYT